MTLNLLGSPIKEELQAFLKVPYEGSGRQLTAQTQEDRLGSRLSPATLMLCNSGQTLLPLLALVSVCLLNTNLMRMKWIKTRNPLRIMPGIQ